MELFICLCLIGLVDSFILSTSKSEDFDQNSRLVFGCENTNLTITCPSGKRIHIDDAMYGRIDSSTRNPCISHNQKIDCTSNNSMSVTQSMCQGVQSCQIAVTNRMFKEDPCKNAIKYLRVRYTCTDARKSTTLYATISGLCIDAFGRCNAYGFDVCTSYREWASQNCAKFCKFCIDKSSTVATNPSSFYQSTSSPGRCIDRIINCQAYGQTSCTTYPRWAEKNCPRTCGSCGSPNSYSTTTTTTAFSTTTPFTTSLATTTKGTTAITVSSTFVSSLFTTQESTTIYPIKNLNVHVFGDCTDHLSVCASYEKSICITFAAWALRQCAEFCKFCTPTTSPMEQTTKPACVDIATDCETLGPDACVHKQTLALQNCRRFCLFCKD